MTKSITTQGGSITAKTAGKKKKQNYLRRCIKRKNCIFCFVFNIVFAFAIVGAIAFVSFKYVEIRGLIADAGKRKELLTNRMDIDAYFHQGKCQIYPNEEHYKQLEKSDQAFCNRYCEGNYHMEFLSRSVQWKKEDHDHDDCPHYVELRPCRSKMTTTDANDANPKCLKKKFKYDYIAPKEQYMGICIACPHSSSPPSNGQ